MPAARVSFRLAGRRALSVIRLRDGVERVQRDNGQVLFLGPDGTALRVSAAALSLYDALRVGATFEQLADVLRASHPAASGVEEKLKMFLGQLTTSRLVVIPSEVEGPPADARDPLRMRGIPRFARDDRSVDRIAAPIARALSLLPRFFFVLPTLAAIAGFIALGNRWPRTLDVIRTHDYFGIAIVFFLAIPLHELAHAVAARLAGVPAGKLGIRLKPFGIPRPYVTVPHIYRVTSRGMRCAIPLAGPFLDLMIAGACAWILTLTPSATAALVLTYALMSLTVGTSPLPDGDGSHAAESFFNDETLRAAALRGKRGPFTRASAVRAYRLWTVIHTLIAGALLVGFAR